MEQQVPTVVSRMAPYLGNILLTQEHTLEPGEVWNMILLGNQSSGPCSLPPPPHPASAGAHRRKWVQGDGEYFWMLLRAPWSTGGCGCPLFPGSQGLGGCLSPLWQQAGLGSPPLTCSFARWFLALEEPKASPQLPGEPRHEGRAAQLPMWGTLTGRCTLKLPGRWHSPTETSSSHDGAPSTKTQSKT